MFVPMNRGYRRKYVIGGGNILETTAQFLSRLFASNAGKVAADLGKNLARDTATSVSKRLVEKGVNKIFAPKKMPAMPVMTPAQSGEMLGKYGMMKMKKKKNLNALIDGSNIPIQDVMRILNGSGLKIV